MKRKLMFSFLRAAALSVLAGCASVKEPQPPVEVPAPAPIPVPAPAPVKPEMRNPVAIVTAQSANAGSAGLAAAMKAQAERVLVAKGFDVPADESSAAASDFGLRIEATRRQAAQLGEWLVYEGDVKARLWNAARNTVIADASFSAKGEKGLGGSKAEANLERVLGAKLSDWLSKTANARKVPVQPAAQPATSK